MVMAKSVPPGFVEAVGDEKVEVGARVAST